MPEIDAWLGLSFHMYFFDNQRHKLPHIHIRYGEYELTIAIETGEFLEGYLPKKQRRRAQRYIESRSDVLMAMWNLAVKGVHPRKVGDLC